MFTYRSIDLAPASLRKPLRMPLDVLLALAPNQTPGVTEAFNVLGVCNELLGKFGWTRATRVLNPKVWAPGWSGERFGALLSEAGLAPELGSEVRVHDFIGLDVAPGSPARAPAEYDIVHFVGEVFHEGDDQTPLLVLGDAPDAPMVRPGALRDALVHRGRNSPAAHATSALPA